MHQLELFSTSQSLAPKPGLDNFHGKPPALGKILDATWSPKYTAVLGQRQFQKLDEETKQWNANKNRLLGEAFHKRMQQHFNREPLLHYCDFVEGCFRSVQKTGILAHIGQPLLVEKSVLWQGEYPYKAMPDIVAPYKGSLYVIQWTSKTEPVAVVEQLGDKLAQVTAEARAVEDYFNYEISGALVVVAYPKGEATICTIARQCLEECWRDRVLPRLQHFYDARLPF